MGGSILQKRCLADTGIEVSVLGLGTVKIGRNTGVKYPQGFALPSDEQVKKLLHKARELGINLLDTAPAYGSSEERLGQFIKNTRSEWVIMSKVGEEFVNNTSQFDFTPNGMIESVERSLKRLGTDYLDILLIHSNGEDEHLIRDLNVFESMRMLKRSGKIRAFGLSSKTIAGGLLSLQQSDCAMVAYNPSYLDELPVIQAAEKMSKGIFIKKAFASGHWLQSKNNEKILESFRCIFKEKAITSVITGTLNIDHLSENAACLQQVIRS